MIDATVIHVNDPGTWPGALLDHVEMRAREFEGTAEYTSDLGISPEGEDAFRRLFSGRYIRVFHATRLLDHECEAIRSSGLQRLTLNLVEERIVRAMELGLIAAGVGRKLLENHVFALGRAEFRASQVCFFVPENSLFEDPSGVWRLLSFWGGEAIYWAPADEPETAIVLRSIGRPAIVAANIDLGAGWTTHLCAPNLEKLFVGSYLGLERSWSDVLYRADVPGHQIVDVWRPGDAEYDRFPELPQ
jgi:hypothetical protein